jgi:DNA-binding transcriptional LysR family regulator
MDHRYQKFLAVAETGSFSLAAKRLHVTQPAITLAVLSLERAYDTKFCLRLKRSVELTEDGIALAQACSKIAQEIDKLKIRVNKQPTNHRYSIGLVDSVAQLIYSSSSAGELLGGASVMVDNSRSIIADLQVGKIDAGLITGQKSVVIKDVNIKKMHDEEFVFVYSSKLSDLNNKEIHDWLAFNQYSTTYQHFSKLFKRLGLNVKPVFYSTSMEILKDMALSGKGTALLPRHIVQKYIDNGMLKVVKIGRLSRPLWAITRKDSVPDNSIVNILSKVDDMLSAK